MILIQSTNRGIALIAPKYYRGINPARVNSMINIYGQPRVLSDLDFDNLVWALMTGTDSYAVATGSISG